MKGWKHILKTAVKLSVRDTVLMIGVLTIMTLLSFFFRVFDQDTRYASMLYVLAVFLIARLTEGYFYGVAASFASVLLVNYLFTYPNFRFNFTLTGYPIAIVVMLAVSITTSTLTTRAKYVAAAKLDVEREITRSNLLRAVSHDLRTPLTAILGASSAIMENDDTLTKEERLALLRDVRDDAQWLIRMVENLLTITRIDETRAAKVVKTPEAGEEILETAVSKFRKQYPEWLVIVQIPEEFLLIPMDAVLIEQVLMNLLENAVNHAVGADRIWLALEREKQSAVFRVADNGNGINPVLLPDLFHGKLPSSSSIGDKKRNMGIGLSVCHTIVRAHDGVLCAENRKEGGAEFRFVLPLEEENYDESTGFGGGR